MSISGLRFGHVAFKVADTERSVRWYSDAFGAKKIYAEAQGTGQSSYFWNFPGDNASSFSQGAKTSCLRLQIRSVTSTSV